MQLEEMNRAQQAGYAENILGLMPYYQEAFAEPEIEAPDLLSVAEAKSLGVPYGTTSQEATEMGITPGAKVPEVAGEPEVGKVSPYAGMKMVDIPGKTFSIPVDPLNVTSATIKQLRNAGMNDQDIYAWLDTNTKLTATAIKNLIGTTTGGTPGGGDTIDNILKKYGY